MTRDRLLALLKDIEFSVPTTDPRGTFMRDLDECPECGGAGSHYHPDPNAVCELKAAIDWLEKAGPNAEVAIVVNAYPIYEGTITFSAQAGPEPEPVR